MAFKGLDAKSFFEKAFGGIKEKAGEFGKTVRRNNGSV